MNHENRESGLRDGTATDDERCYDDNQQTRMQTINITKLSAANRRLVARDAEPELEAWFNDYVRRHGRDPSIRQFNAAARRIYDRVMAWHLEYAECCARQKLRTPS
jgi:hypothetical protein